MLVKMLVKNLVGFVCENKWGRARMLCLKSFFAKIQLFIISALNLWFFIATLSCIRANK